MASTSRRERTFIGSRCAVCEEPLEHILHGERILQLACGHVSHEACFYEYIKEFEAETCPTCDAPLQFDTRRGGNIDFETLNKLVRAVRTPDLRERPREAETTPVPWEAEPNRPPPDHQSPQSRATTQKRSRDHLLPEQVTLNGRRYERFTTSTAHNRQESGDTGGTGVTGVTGVTGKVSSTDYREAQQNPPQRHDYEGQSVESSIGSPRLKSKNPIPPPTVLVRSEFPTITKSRHQQSLTCLITIEVPEGKWRPQLEDVRGAIPVPATIAEEVYEMPQPHAQPPPPPPPPSRPASKPRRPVDSVHEELQALEEVKEELFKRVENWHGLDFHRFGKLLLYGLVRVGKDRQTWQDLECYLFTEMLICVKEKKMTPNPNQQQQGGPIGHDHAMNNKRRCTLKGSILIKKHLKQVQTSPDKNILTLSLSVVELPSFHLEFREREALERWRKALMNINAPEPLESQAAPAGNDSSSTDDDEYAHQASQGPQRASTLRSSYAARSQMTAATEYSNPRNTTHDSRSSMSLIHIPLDVVVVIPVSSSTQGLKISLLRDCLRFLLANLGDRDRMGLVSFGSSGGGVPLVGMTAKTWRGWSRVLESIRPLGQKNVRADVVDGANVAMDLLMQRKTANPLSHIMLISDSATSDTENVDFVVSRAEAAKIAIHTFGLGLTHKPDTMVELSTRTKASYTYVKDWMMLRECVAGCLGSLQSTSHQNVKLKLRLPEGSPAKFGKISGALSITKRATGRDAEASLGDLRFGDKRDILVQLAIHAETGSPDSMPSDPWENIISGLEALGPIDQDDSRTLSVEEMPLIQVDLSWGDILREGSICHLPRPSLLAITVLPAASKKHPNARPPTPPIPPHPMIVQRRMELLASDMLSRALGLVTKGQHDRALHLLSETRSILRGLSKGGLPPLPTPPPTCALPPPPPTPKLNEPMKHDASQIPLPPTPGPMARTPSPPRSDAVNLFNNPTTNIDSVTMSALDSELEASLEWIAHPTVFSRDSRKAVLQAIGCISSQRGYTFRTAAESLWAARIAGIRRLTELSREWRDPADD